jgi:hypothetical protein
LVRRRHERFSISLSLFVLGSTCRFEPDMLAFSGCTYGLGPEQEAKLVALSLGWKKTRSFGFLSGHISDRAPEALKRNFQQKLLVSFI